MDAGKKLDRRTVLRTGAALGVAGLAAALAACAPESGAPRTSTASAAPDAAPVTGPATSTTPAASATPAMPRVLLAHFSRAGENYWDGGRRVIDVGNTQRIADMIAAHLAVDVYRIEAAEPYPFEYAPTVERNTAELRADARPAIASPLPDLSDYDVILLGNPVWAVQEPMIMRTFIEGVDLLAGKTVHPFVTYAVSRFGRVLDDYAQRCPDALFGEALAVRGEEAADAEADVVAWLRRIGLVSE